MIRLLVALAFVFMGHSHNLYSSPGSWGTGDIYDDIDGMQVRVAMTNGDSQCPAPAYNDTAMIVVWREYIAPSGWFLWYAKWDQEKMAWGPARHISGTVGASCPIAAFESDGLAHVRFMSTVSGMGWWYTTYDPATDVMALPHGWHLAFPYMTIGTP